MRSAIVECFGIGALPEGATLVDWPVGYKDLEPYYDRFEWDIGISGQVGNVQGEIIAGGNPFEEPRRRGYPMWTCSRTGSVFGKIFLRTVGAFRQGYAPVKVGWFCYIRPIQAVQPYKSDITICFGGDVFFPKNGTCP